VTPVSVRLCSLLSESIAAIQVLRLWQAHCQALVKARRSAEERFAAAQSNTLRCSVRAWSTLTLYRIQCRAHAEKAVLHRILSQQAHALRAWNAFTCDRRWEHSATQAAASHFRHSRLSLVLSCWCSLARGRPQSFQPLAKTRQRMFTMHVMHILDIWSHSARSLVYEGAMGRVAASQHARTLAARAFSSCLAYARCRRAGAEKRNLVTAVARKHHSDSALAVWHNAMQHAQQQDSNIAHFKRACGTRMVSRALGGWWKVVEAMKLCRLEAHAAALRRRHAVLLKVLTAWRMCNMAIRQEKRCMETALLHWTNRYQTITLR
jgi:hypothetical protein